MFVFRVLKTCSYWIQSVQLLSHVQLFATPWTVACQASLSITNSQSLLKLMFLDQGGELLLVFEFHLLSINFI